MQRCSRLVNWCSALVVGCIAMMATGCPSPTDPTPPDDTALPAAETALAPAETASAPAETAPPEVSVELASWSELNERFSQYRGKVIVVDIWSTFCEPCMREFPGLVRLQEKYPDRVVCVSLNCNYAGSPDEPPDAARPSIEKFLRAQHATLKNIICTDSDESLFETLKLASIPAVLVYDQQGQLHKRFDNDSNEYGEEGFGYEKQIVPLVEKLLADGSRSDTAR